MLSMPGIGQLQDYRNPIDDMLRSLLWTTGNDDDVAVDDDNDADRNVDITNVVWGWECSTYGWGEIKQRGTPNVDDFVYTVACWEESTGVGEGDIWFSVLWRDGLLDSDHVGTAIQVDSGQSSKLQKWPSITAHLGEYDEEEYAIIVDVAYELSNGYTIDPPWTGQWEIRHCRYAMTGYGDDTDFNSFDELITETVSDDSIHDCFHPDIVFDCAYDDDENPAAKNRLHLVYEVDYSLVPQSIYYRFGEEDDVDDINWDDEYQINGEGETDSYPRIDVGQDDSGHVTYDLFQNPDSIYYVGVTWMHAVYSSFPDPGWITDIDCAALPPDGDVMGYVLKERLTNNTSPRLIYALPFIDIEPLAASTPRTTMVTWTCIVYDHGNYPLMSVQATNTLKLENEGAFASDEIVEPDDVPFRNGLATLALEETTSKEGYLVWLNDGWSYEYSTATDVEVYAGDLSWDWGVQNYEIEVSNFENISDGLSSWAINNGYVYGPEVAIFHDDRAFCVWTDIDNGTPPSIWGDASDL